MMPFDHAAKFCGFRTLFRLGFLILFGCLGACLTAKAAEPTLRGEFVNRVYQDEFGSHKYVVFVPPGYVADKAWPTILWLHGASARGKDGRIPLVAGIAPNIHQRLETFPFLVVFPQCENLNSRLLGGWTDERDDADRALKILQAVEQDYRVDPRRRILAGVSMGAFGVWAIGARTADRWSALVPVSGGGPVQITEQLKSVPVWAFHAADDQVVPTTASTDLVNAINARGGRGFYTELPDGGHNIGSRVFAKDEIYTWLLNPRQTPTQPQDWSQKTVAVPQLQQEVPFVPGAEMEHAVRIAIGRDVLNALALSLPKHVPAEAMQGVRGPQSQVTDSGLTSFQVTVSGVQYQGQIQTARLEPLPENQLRIRLGISPLTMTVLSTEIQGRILRAQAGPMQVVIGSQRPAWLNVVVQPGVEARQLKLKLISAEFPIEADNWYVTQPSSVDVFPLPGLRDRISQRLTNGLYAKQQEIEQQVIAGVPKMLEQIERQSRERFQQVVTFGRWPMPVWQPRAKFWLSGLNIDAQGLSVSLGVTLAALAPQSDRVPIRQHAGPKDHPAPPAHGIQVAVAREVLTAWTELLAASDVRRFHVQDFHAKSFHRLAERDFLSQALPGTIRREDTAELRSVLSFEQPIHIDPLAVTADMPRNSSAMRLAGRELRLTISERQTPDSPWEPVAEFPFSWSQDLRMTMKQTSHRQRQLEVIGLAPIEVISQGRVLRTSKQASPTVQDRLVEEQFRLGWDETFAAALTRELAVSERQIAGVPFVCESFGLQGEFLLARLAAPTTQIRNLSPDKLTYEVRSPESGWSQPVELLPGKMHEYRGISPLTWRSQQGERSLEYTLPVGTVSHFRGSGEHPLTLSYDSAPKETRKDAAANRR